MFLLNIRTGIPGRSLTCATGVDKLIAQIDISIIIVVENRVEALPTLLSCLEKQSLPAGCYEVILVFYGNLSPEPLARVHHYAAGAPMAVQCLIENVPNEVAAKNLGAKNTSGRILLFLDQDLLAGPHLLSAHTAFHASSPIPKIIMGSIEKSPSLSRSKLTRWFLQHDQELMPADKADSPFFWSSRHCSIPRDIFQSANGFNEGYSASRASDLEFTLRIRKKCEMTSLQECHAFIWHEARFHDERKRFFQEGFDLCQLSIAQKNPEILHHFQLNCSRTRFKMDSLFTPFYVRTCEEEPLDIRVHGPSCQRVFWHALHCGASAALAKTQDYVKVVQNVHSYKHDVDK